MEKGEQKSIKVTIFFLLMLATPNSYRSGCSSSKFVLILLIFLCICCRRSEVNVCSSNFRVGEGGPSSAKTTPACGGGDRLASEKNRIKVNCWYGGKSSLSMQLVCRGEGGSDLGHPAEDTYDRAQFAEMYHFSVHCSFASFPSDISFKHPIRKTQTQMRK